MAENFDKQVYESPLYPLLKVVGYRFHGALKSQKAVDIELSKIASAIEKHKEKLTPEQAEIYQKALDDMAKPAKEKKEESAVDEKTPEADEKAPVADEKAPDVDEKAPVAGEKTPEADEKAPDVDEKAPVAGEKTPEADEKAPVAGEKKPETDEKAPSEKVVESAPKGEKKVKSEDPCARDSFYQIAKIIGMDVSIYDSQDEAVSTKISTDLRKKIAQNTDEENEKIRELLKKNERLLKKFNNTLTQIQQQKQKQEKQKEQKQEQQEKKQDATAQTEKTEPTSSKPKDEKGETTMAKEDKTPEGEEKDFNKMLRTRGIYLTAAALTDPKIDLSAYTATDEASLNAALDAIKATLKKRMSDEAQREKDMNDLKDKPELKEEYEKIEKEDKPEKTITVDPITDESEGPTHDTSWIEAKKAFWQAYAKANELTPDFDDPAEEKAPFYCKLSKDDKEEGFVRYSAEDKAQISKNSSLKMYKGIVADAAKNKLSITFGTTLGEKQKLMLYAAILASGDKVPALNPPSLTKDVLTSEAFASLDDEAKKIIVTEIKRRKEEKSKEVAAHIEKLRKIVAAREAKLTPEEKAKRDAKQLERDKIMAARLGIIPEYVTKYDNDIKEEIKKDGKVVDYKIIHKKGDKRVVKTDAELMKDGKLNEDRISKEQFDALMKRKSELEGK